MSSLESKGLEFSASGRLAILAVAVFCLLISGCGFQPLYGNAGADGKQAIESHFPEIAIGNIPDRDGQFLRNLLIDRLHAQGAAPARYTLSVSPVNKNIASIGVRKDATSTRGQILVNTRIRLIEKNSNAVLLDRTVRALGGYNRLDNLYATLVSEQDSTERVLEDLSEAIITELALYFRRPQPDSAGINQDIEPKGFIFDDQFEDEQEAYSP